MSPNQTIVDAVAVVDDDPSIRKVLSRLLRLAGFRVTTYESGEEFLCAILITPLPACVVLDVHLGGRSGPEIKFDLTQTGARIPVIFMTADDETAGQRCLRPCLHKPFSGAQLISLIREALTPGNLESV